MNANVEITSNPKDMISSSELYKNFCSYHGGNKDITTQKFKQILVNSHKICI